MSTQGIIIYAIGHENYYRMAEVLAASIAVNASKPLSVAILCDDPKKIHHRSLFHRVIEIEDKYFLVDGKVVFNNATIRMYQFSPYQHTLKLDADMIWLNGRDPLELFAQLEGVELGLMNGGKGWGKGNSVWTDEDALRDAYGFGGDHHLYKIYGEFVYFQKGAKAQSFFKAAKAIYQKPKVKSAPFSNGTFTDELAFQIAAMSTGIYPHAEGFTHVFNSFLGRRDLQHKYAYQLPKEFFAWSIGGNYNSPWIKGQYNILANHYYKKLGLQNPYQVKDKRSFLPERIKL